MKVQDIETTPAGNGRGVMIGATDDIKAAPTYSREAQAQEITTGEACAAFLAAGIGSLTLGLLTTLVQAFQPIKDLLTFSKAVGPLSGKTIVAVVVWLIAWVALNYMWKGKQINFPRTFMVTLGLIALGFLGTFPIFYDLFPLK